MPDPSPGACPHCGSLLSTCERHIPEQPTTYLAFCEGDGCYARGPIAMTKSEAADRFTRPRAFAERFEAMREALERLASEAQKYVDGYEDDSRRGALSFCQGCYSRPTMLEDEVEKSRALLDAEVKGA